MTLRLVTVLGLATLCLAGTARSQEPRDEASTPSATRDASSSSTRKSEKPSKPKIEQATFAGGCFWSMEAVFERIPGVKDVVSGFAGGSVINPSYEMVGTGLTGHAESIHVVYDASVVTYEDLLKVFFSAHDPTTLNAQGDDFGPQYRSVIFYHNEDQRKAALAAYRDLTTRKAFRNPIVTDLVAYQTFYPAEEYHQDYYRNHRGSYYSQVYIDSKLKKLKLTGKATPKTSKTSTKPRAVTGGK